MDTAWLLLLVFHQIYSCSFSQGEVEDIRLQYNLQDWGYNGDIAFEIEILY